MQFETLDDIFTLIYRSSFKTKHKSNLRSDFETFLSFIDPDPDQKYSRTSLLVLEYIFSLFWMSNFNKKDHEKPEQLYKQDPNVSS